jgi:PAS domain S-box-containing protein
LEWGQDLLQSIVENTAVDLAYLDPGFNYLYVNPAYARGTGHRVDELIGRNHFELFPHSESRAVFEQVRENGQPANLLATPVEFTDQPQRGTTHWDWSLVPVKDAQGEIQGLVISSTEVTERVRERERLQQELQHHTERLEDMVSRRTAALRASEARFRTIFEDSVVGIALLGPEGQIVNCNPALRDMLGYSEEELYGTAFTDYSHPDDAETDKGLYPALASGQLGYYQVEKRYVRKDGRVRWSELTVARVKSTERRRPMRAIAMVEDITEKKVSQEALLRSERLAVAGRLGASLAHEINNPLQSVIGCLGLAEEILNDGAEVRRYLEIAMEELERAAGIVTQLRDLSRTPEAKKAEPADLNALIEKTLLLTRKRCQNRGVEVAWNPATDLPAVPLAPDRIQQVFLNLVLNAVEAMPEGGRLKVSTTPTDRPEGVHIRFADTGVGIEADRLPQIFEPFHSSRPAGLGLGLYISKKIVDEHKGQIRVHSRMGEGTTFTVWLPA